MKMGRAGAGVADLEETAGVGVVARAEDEEDTGEEIEERGSDDDTTEEQGFGDMSVEDAADIEQRDEVVEEEGEKLPLRLKK